MDRPLQTRTYLCYARSDGDGWEALCVDLDIAVQGETLDEVVATINEAVTSYVEDAKNEDVATARRLLARRAMARTGGVFPARCLRSLASLVAGSPLIRPSGTFSHRGRRR